MTPPARPRRPDPAAGSVSQAAPVDPPLSPEPATAARATPARDVPPGTCWAFLEHRTQAEVMAAELAAAAEEGADDQIRRTQI